MKQNHEILPLIEAMMQYDQRDVVPFDVPGHKHGRGTKVYYIMAFLYSNMTYVTQSGFYFPRN